MIDVGAGTGGRIALVDAAEQGPTFSVPADGVVALLAGADRAPGSAEEAAAEDDEDAGRADLAALRPTPHDVVVGVTASGRTPYVLGAVKAANEAGALTGAVTSNPGSPLAACVDHVVEVPIGAEVISGSTRLKAGTAQKLVLNAFSTALMVHRGRTLGDLMTGTRVANAKLRQRAARVCVQATGCSEHEAHRALAQARDDVSVAILVLAHKTTADEARRRLDLANGALRTALTTNWS